MGLFSWAKRKHATTGVAGAPPDHADLEAIDKQPGQTVAARIDPVKQGIERLSVGDVLGALEAFRRAVVLAPNSAANQVNLAYALQQTGAESEALQHLRRATLLDAQSFDAHYMLGGALERVSDQHGAVEHLQRAVALRPSFEPAHADLCRLLAVSGDTAAARVAITAALVLNPDNADFHHYLGNVCMAEANPSAALESYARALALRPDYAQVHANIGLALHSEKRYEEAVESFERAIYIEPSSGDFYSKLGATRNAQGRLREAAAAIQRALELQPDDSETLNTFGLVLQAQGHLDQAIASFRRAVALRPDLPGGYVNLGVALDEQGHTMQAVELYRKGLAIQPLAVIHHNLAIALQKLDALDEAIEHYRLALAKDPDNMDARCNLGTAFADVGDSQQAISIFREILAAQPEHIAAHSNLLFRMSVNENYGVEEYLAEARRFDRKLTARPLGAVEAAPLSDGRRLRIGFVSGDFRKHPVGFFLEGILQHLDENKTEVFAYSTAATEDELTLRLKPHFVGWRLLKGQSDEVAARAIRSDEIDILFDLGGHTAGGRLQVFAFRPAPVQVSWLGYWASTGLSAMDYVLADDVCVPPGLVLGFTEKVWRLPQTRLCFTPPAADSTPDISGLPALRRGYVTFGCFQRVAKITDNVLAVWGQLFAALPNARLRIQSYQTGRSVYVEQTLARLAAVGISAERVSISGAIRRDLYLESYREVDIVLDTFPYPGGTTTCEALWMGVPTLTLAGSSMIARQGAAMMCAAGLSEWVAKTPAEYLRKAQLLSADLYALAGLRASMRERIVRAPLFDVRLFAGRLEDALVGMWREHLAMKLDAHDHVAPHAPTQNVTC